MKRKPAVQAVLGAVLLLSGALFTGGSAPVPVQPFAAGTGGDVPPRTAHAISTDDLAREGAAHDLVGSRGAISLSPVLPAATVTVSGTVHGPGGPVPDVWIGVGSPQDWQEAITDPTGHYSVSVQTEGSLHFRVRPELPTRLTQINHWTDGVTTSLTQSFTVTQGYLLDLQVLAGGAPLTSPPALDVQPLEYMLRGEWWYQLDWNDATQHLRAVLPPDVYYVTAHDPPAGYYETTLSFDLRAVDLTATLPLTTTYVHPIPYDPPDASKITFGSVDLLGEVVVTGSAGAALPLAHILLVNLNSSHQAHAISEADGSFTARIYAPPGSAIMVKHGPASQRWAGLEAGLSEGVNPFPGTIINLPHTHGGGAYGLPFAAAGGMAISTDDSDTTPNHVGAAWALTGTLRPLVGGGDWTRVLTGTYGGQVVPGLYLGGLNWTHPVLVDLDDDGDADLLVGGQFGRLVFYRNQGSASVPAWQFETDTYAGISTGGWAFPALADVTADGALDLFVGSLDGRVNVYYNDGTPGTPLWPDTPDVSLEAGFGAAPALDDLDGDGDLDLLAGHEGGTLFHFENTGTAADPIWTGRGPGYGGITETGGLQPAFLDLDGDGDRDLLVGLCGELLWYERGGPVNNPTWTRHANDPIGYGGGSCGTSPGVGDWNGDGAEDLVIGEHWGWLRFFRNDGPPNWAEQGFEFPFELAGDTAPALADWDDDGDFDLLLGQAHGQVHRYSNVGTAAEPAWQAEGVLLELPWTDHPHAFPTFADVDGDADLDLFIGEGGWGAPGMGGNIHYYHNHGTPMSPDWTLSTTAFLGLDVGGWSTPVFIDVDADGDLDLFVGDEAGTLTYVENVGTATAPAWAAPVQPYAGLQFAPYSAPAFFDLDEDGDLDMLVGSLEGSLSYVQNTGTASIPAWALVSPIHPQIDVGERSVPAAADLDGDGHADLLLGDGDGGLNLYVYKGPALPPGSGSLYAPGDQFQIQGAVRLYGPAITETTDVGAITVNGHVGLSMQHNDLGQPLAMSNVFMSTLLTPGGFPIQGLGRPAGDAAGGFPVDGLRYLGGHSIGGEFSMIGQLSEDLPSGIYRPHIWIDVSGVPTSTDWLAANVTRFTFEPTEAPLPPIQVGEVSATHRLAWLLLMDDAVQGTRGTAARQDRGTFAMASQIASQSAPYYTPPVDLRTGQPIVYRLEPFLPMVSFTDRRMPTPPLIPFDLPGGRLRVLVREPDGTVTDLGGEPFDQSFNRTKTTRAGLDLNPGTTQMEDVYSLQAASDCFRVIFDQYGHHVITMTGVVSDIWGNSYGGGGTYDVWIAHPLDVDPGVLPGTPLAVGDAFNPAVQFYPRVPAQVTLTLTLYPDSDPARVISEMIAGRANRFGYFTPPDHVSRITDHPGEYRVDLVARYSDVSGTLYMGALTWGGVVMTPAGDAQLVAHGRRGLDSLQYIPNHWFVSGRDLTIPPGAISHSFNPYFNGDLLWSRMIDGPYGGDALLLGASVQDTVGTIEAAIEARFERMHPELASPGTFAERVAVGELPLFISTRSGRPPQVVPDDVDQVAYSYRSSQRPGVRVREVVAEDGQTGGYWRLDTLYDDQLGVGVLGDQANDFKFQYVGTVYRDLDTGHSEYQGQGTGWVFIPDDDPTGTRVMPPYAGFGGWTAEGGPILTLKGQDIHVFILPMGVRPGAVLQTGDLFRFAGHIMPTLDSQVRVTVTAPSGAQRFVAGQANSVGYFYSPADDFVVGEPGRWSVDVRVWHDGSCSGGTVDCASMPSRPCPSGDVLGSEAGRFWFYVVPPGSPRLEVVSPPPGFLTFQHEVTPIVITGTVPAGLNAALVDYTISMPGYILTHGQVTPTAGIYQIVLDPVALKGDYPNLDLIGRDTPKPGLADTLAIGLLLEGRQAGRTVYRANTITLQGEQVFVGNAPSPPENRVHLPLLLRHHPSTRVREGLVR